jgi:hypothetical protein
MTNKTLLIVLLAPSSLLYVDASIVDQCPCCTITTAAATTSTAAAEVILLIVNL